MSGLDCSKPLAVVSQHRTESECQAVLRVAYDSPLYKLTESERGALMYWMNKVFDEDFIDDLLDEYDIEVRFKEAGE